MKINFNQREALITAYTDCTYLIPADPDEEGVEPKTIRSLVKNGLIEADDKGDFWGSYSLTKYGRDMLGLNQSVMRKPKGLKTALKRAITLFMEPHAQLGNAIFPPAKINSTKWADDEWEADYSDALMVIDIDLLGMTDFDEKYWGAVARLVRELGFDIDIDCDGLIGAVWEG